MAQFVSDKKLKKGAKVAEKIDVKDFPFQYNLVPPHSMWLHPDLVQTPFSEEQKGRVARLVAIVSEMDSPWGETIVKIEQDMWPEKDILMWESVVSSYELVLRRRKIKVRRGRLINSKIS